MFNYFILKISLRVIKMSTYTAVNDINLKKLSQVRNKFIIHDINTLLSNPIWSIAKLSSQIFFKDWHKNCFWQSKVDDQLFHSYLISAYISFRYTIEFDLFLYMSGIFAAARKATDNQSINYSLQTRKNIIRRPKFPLCNSHIIDQYMILVFHIQNLFPQHQS